MEHLGMCDWRALRFSPRISTSRRLPSPREIECRRGASKTCKYILYPFGASICSTVLLTLVRSCAASWGCPHTGLRTARARVCHPLEDLDGDS